jgi:hypothetical protein
VVQRAEVRDLDRLGGGHDVVGDAGSELRGEQCQHGAHALAAGFEEVAGRDIRDRIAKLTSRSRPGLDALDALVDRPGHGPVGG